MVPATEVSHEPRACSARQTTSQQAREPPSMRGDGALACRSTGAFAYRRLVPNPKVASFYASRWRYVTPDPFDQLRVILIPKVER